MWVLQVGVACHSWYLCHAQGKVLGDQPFCDEGIVDILHQSMFNGENSIGVRSHEDFVSVLDDNDEPELPVAMVALVATIVGF